MNKMATCLWFDDQAEAAVDFYLSVFDGGKKGREMYYSEVGQEAHGQQPGSVMTIDFELAGHQFVALNGGLAFTLNPSISFILNFDPSMDANATETIEHYWQKLSEGGKVLMEFQEYPFSKKYGWVQDKFGVSWQLMLTDPEGEDRPFITPELMFTLDKIGKAEEAINFYTSVFKNSRVGNLARYPSDTGSTKAGTLMYSDFMLENEWFAAMDAGSEQDFTFSEAISFVVNCDTQEEIDYYWEKLSAVPEFEQCGWLKDKYGVSWQIVPTMLNDLIDGTDEKSKRALAAMMEMKKLDIAALEAAANQ